MHIVWKMDVYIFKHQWCIAFKNLCTTCI